MSATIRLMRVGKRANPSYRIIVIDKRKKQNGLYLEKIGFYNPLAKPPVLELKKDRYDFWVKNGAELSEGIVKLKKQINRSFPNRSG